MRAMLKITVTENKGKVNVDIGDIHVELTPAEFNTLTDQCLALSNGRKRDAEILRRATSREP
jgi:hypothetical protein